MLVRARSKNEKFSFEIREGETVLYAGLRHGLALPYECATGTCGTCKARVREPSTISEGWIDAPGNTYLKRERGEFLMCQTCAVADCEIAIPAEIAAKPIEINAPYWTTGKLGSLKRLTHDVISFTVTLSDPMTFEAGQFAILQVPAVKGFRAYSMVNFDRGTSTLDFVVKRKPDGAFSDWLFENAEDGVELEVFGPLGRAVFNPTENRDLICIAGGSGVAGMMAILAHGCEANFFAERKGQLFFGVRTLKDAFFMEELAGFVSQFPDKLEVTIALSDEDVPTEPVPCGGRLRFSTGFVHTVASESIEGPCENSVAFVAGPPPMVDGALRMLIMQARLPAQFIRYDKFS